MSFLFLIGCYNPPTQENVNANDCSDTISIYLSLCNQFGYLTPGMKHIQHLYAGDSIHCVELREAVKSLREMSDNQNALLEILKEPRLDTFYRGNEKSIYRAMIIDAQIPLVRMIRINQSGQLTYKVAEYIDSFKKNILIDDSTIYLSLNSFNWMELNSKIKEAYFWDLTTNEFNPHYFTGESWSLEGVIFENGYRYFHRVIRINPPIHSSYRRLIEYFFILFKRKG